MNYTDFVQTGGFPLKGERLQEMVTAYSIFNALGYLAGNLTILSGCNVVGISVSDGYVFINGEVLPFKGAFLAANVIIIEEVSSKEFENGELKPVHYERYATFGTADTSYPWGGFIRPKNTKELTSLLQTLSDQLVVHEALYNNRLNIIETKLATIQTGAEVNVQADWNVTDTNADAFVKNKLSVQKEILAKGSFNIGDVAGADTTYTVYFPTISTSQYYVLGGLRIASGAWDNSNDVIWSYTPINNSAFSLYLREVAANVQNLVFDYIIVAK